MRVKRLLVLTMLVSLVICVGCGSKKVTKTSNTGVEPTEELNNAIGGGTQEGIEGTESEGTTEGAATNEGALVEGSNTELTSEGQVITNGEEKLTEKALEDEKSMEAYEKFLKNETLIFFENYKQQVISSDDLFEMGRGYTLSEVLKNITTDYLQYSENKKVDAIDYSYIDCGKDGVRELVLRFKGMNIYSQDDDSTLVYIIKYKEEKLVLCFSYETWARSESSINEFGYYGSQGSGGASNHGESYGFVDKDGNWQFIVSISREFDINQLFWPEEIAKIPIVAEKKGITQGIEFDTIYFNENDSEKVVYTFYVYDENVEIETAGLYTNSIYKDVFDEAMVTFYTPDEISAMIKEKKDQIGATDEIVNGEEVAWLTLDSSMFEEFVER